MNFYLLEWPDDLDQAAYAHATDEIETCVVCETCGRNWFLQTKDLDIELYGLDLDGFVWTLGCRLVVTDDLLRSLLDAGVSGFSQRPVRFSYVSRSRGGENLLKGSDHLEPPLLHQLEILTNNAKPPSEFASFSVCPTCGHHDFVRWTPPDISIDGVGWNGADVFTHRYVDVIITQRFLDVLRQNGIGNYKVSPLQTC
jgi:hypothetical protein